MIGLYRQCAVIAGDRIVIPSQVMQGVAAVKQENRTVRNKRDRAINELKRSRWVFLLTFEHTQKMQGICITWILGEHFSIKRCRFGKLAILMKGNCVFE